jgi:hypothetical protein
MSPTALAIAACTITLGGPLLLGLAGATNGWRASDWRLTLTSALLSALAFNLVFFIQELFLVLPKAMTPGLDATLYHNNHSWEGDNPIARLFQGTGAVAIFIVALAMALWLRLRPMRSLSLQILLFWIAFSGFFQSLPQVVVGAAFPGNDVGMAMEYLGLSAGAKAAAAFLALLAIAATGVWLGRESLRLASQADEIATPTGRASFVFRIVTLPALLALPLIILSRVPGSIDQVVIVPAAVMIIGVSWLQASVWRRTAVRASARAPIRSLLLPASAYLAILLVFHLLLRPGIDFA